MYSYSVLPMIASYLDPCAPCIVYRSPAPGLKDFARLSSYNSTLFLSLSLCVVSANVLRSTETCKPPLQSYSPWPQLICIIVTIYLRHDVERLETRLALYLVGTAAVEDWVVRAAALSGCILEFCK